MERPRNRMKGQADEMSMLQQAGIAIVVVVVFVAIGSQILGAVRTQALDTNQFTATNEQFTPTCTANASTAFPEGSDTVNCTTTSNASLAQTNLVSGTDTVVNASGGNSVPSESYRLFLEDGNFELINNSWNNTQMNITYNFDTEEETPEFNVTGQGLAGLSTFADFFVVIIVVLVAVFVIALLMRELGGGRV